MDKAKLLARLMKTFVSELTEHIEALNTRLLALEKAAPAEAPDIVNDLFRSAHSLKGAARSVDVKEIEDICHRLEDMFAAARDEQKELGADHLELAFATVDALQEAGTLLEQGGTLDASGIADLTERFDTLDTDKAGDKPPATGKTKTVRKTASAATDTEPAQETPPPAPEDTPPPPVAEAPQDITGSSDGFVRIRAAKLDEFLEMSGELQIARLRLRTRQKELDETRVLLDQLEREWNRVAPVSRQLFKDRIDGADGIADRNTRKAFTGLTAIPEHLGRLKQSYNSLTKGLVSDWKELDLAAVPIENEVRKVRMFPFKDACAGLDRTVRDLAKAGQKQVGLHIRGSELDLDRSILESLKAPLLHLVRNAIDHGIESPKDRKANGKPEEGRVVVSARISSGRVKVSVEDDGRGLDLNAIRARAEQRDIPVPADADAATELLFQPGFSTAHTVTGVSGRGVGLDAVRWEIEQRNGSISVSHETGQGTRFDLSLPLTLTNLHALLVRVGEQIFAVNANSVERATRLAADELTTFEGRQSIVYDDRSVPACFLADALGTQSTAENGNDTPPTVIVRNTDQMAAFFVDEIIGNQDVLVKGLGRRLGNIRGVSGASLLPDGRLVIILHSDELVHHAFGLESARIFSADDTDAAVQRKNVLVVDDSTTTRLLEANILEAEGYSITTASDGTEAMDVLHSRDIDLIVSDVEMPGMDGISLTVKVRETTRFSHLPIVLLTARETEEDKLRGLKAGADAYLVKSAFDQSTLLETIDQLLA